MWKVCMPLSMAKPDVHPHARLLLQLLLSETSGSHKQKEFNPKLTSNNLIAGIQQVWAQNFLFDKAMNIIRYNTRMRMSPSCIVHSTMPQ